jgi:prepilin-type N-terminal cleavage/methylation domain-containing protein
MKHGYMNNDRGMGLLEVLVSMIILAIGLLGLAPMIVTSIEGNIIARDHTTASNLVKQKVEYFQGLDSLPATPYTETESNVMTGFTRTSRIEDRTSDSSIADGLYLVEVEVAWTDNQVDRTTAFSTFILKD